MKRSFGLAITLTVSLIVSLVVIGAGSKSAESASNPVTIGFALPDFSELFWISIAYGIDEEAKALGATVIKVNAGGDNNVDQQISQLQDLIQRHVSVLIVGATDGAAVKAVVNQAVAAGIPVIGISSIPDSDKISAAIGADHYGMGRLQAECLGAAIGGKGEVAALEFPAGQSWADLRAKGFVETIKKEFPQIKLVAEDRIATVRTETYKVTQDWIQRFPDLAGIFSAYDEMGAGAVDAIKAAGKTGQIKVSSSNLSAVGEQLIRSGDLACETTQQVVLQGHEAAQAAVTAASGGQPKKEVVTSAIMVTKDNIDAIDFKTIRAPTNYHP